MAQLSDDCFAFGGPMMSVDEAVALIAARLSPVAGHERVPVLDADGRILAADLVAPLPLPPFANSAVDGYAVRHSDLAPEGETRMSIGARVEAGARADGVAGKCVRIFTGAPMPDGFDTVFMQEDVKVEADGAVLLPSGLKRGANMRPAGEDIAQGSIALARGARLGPQHVALAAALGRTTLDVARRLRVAVFSTGNELVSPGEPQQPPQIYDSNRFMLMAQLKRLGCAVSDLGILRDDRATLGQALKAAAAQHDLIVTSGGVSTGEADHVKGAVEDVGRLAFWRIAIKPGRPVAMGVIDGAAFIGLPGNPAASFITQTYIVRPAVLAMMGAEHAAVTPLPVRAAFAYKKKPGRREYARASLHRADDGAIEARKFPREGAGLLSSLVDTHGLVELREDVTRIEPGMMVGFLPYATLF